MIYPGLTTYTNGPWSDEVTSARASIVADIMDGPVSDHYMLRWFSDAKWTSNRFHSSHRVMHGDELVGMSSSIPAMGGLKVFCHLYVLRKFRSSYRGIHHTCILPKDLAIATAMGLSEVWYSIHPFDTRHRRYSESQQRHINGSGFSSDQSGWKRFHYDGSIIYNGVEQDRFVMRIEL